MQREDMDRLIEEHLKAEKAGDPLGSVAMYTPDVIHDVVGSPAGPLHGPKRRAASTRHSPTTSPPRRWTSLTPGAATTAAP
jgi:hypothetical protein